MTAGPTVKSRFWPRAGWWLAVALVMAMQLGFIFALGSRLPITPRKTKPAPTIHLAYDEPNELLRLSDPTMFVLPHQEGFSGRAWLQVPPQVPHPFQWTEPQRWLRLTGRNLGAVFNDFMSTNFFEAAHFETMPPPELTLPDSAPSKPLMAKTTVRVGGALVGRQLLAPLELPPGSADVQRESVVQVLVDANGNTLSPVLLVGCGLAAMDSLAVTLAKSARFEPLPRNQAGGTSAGTVGKMIFNWQIISSATNAPPNP